MNKKLIISLSVLFGVIVLVLISFWTLFGLKTVSVEYKTTTKNLNITNEEIVEAGNFNYGSCVLFAGKKKYIERINNFASENENFAYARIVNIETVFPNKFVIHIAEREELFAVENGSQFLICDREFRVLKIVEEFSSMQNNSILLKGVSIEKQNIAVGDFLTIGQSAMKKFYSIMLQNNSTYSQQIGKFKEITLETYQDEITKIEYVSMTMKTFQDRILVVNNIDFAFANKVQKLFAVESSIYNRNTDADGNILDSNNQIVYVVENEKGEYVSYNASIHTEEQKVALSYAILSKCCIKVDNFTLSDFVKRDENDIFYSFVKLS